MFSRFRKRVKKSVAPRNSTEANSEVFAPAELNKADVFQLVHEVQVLVRTRISRCNVSTSMSLSVRPSALWAQLVAQPLEPRPEALGRKGRTVERYRDKAASAQIASLSRIPRSLVCSGCSTIHCGNCLEFQCPRYSNGAICSSWHSARP
jgi:hypothetical protein